MGNHPPLPPSVVNYQVEACSYQLNLPHSPGVCSNYHPNHLEGTGSVFIKAYMAISEGVVVRDPDPDLFDGFSCVPGSTIGSQESGVRSQESG